MVTYKKHDLLAYMPDVQKCDRSITVLNDQWDNVKLLCEINCPTQSRNILPNMTKIQNSFNRLQQDLIDTLIAEKLNKMDQKILSKAQVAVDILIRNLYERTADVGFLATDDEIRKFVCMEDKTEEASRKIQNRLREYVAKYSVYEEIIILDKDFHVIANLDPDNPVMGRTIADPILQKTLESDKEFVESFQPSALQAGKKKAHIFSSKIYAEDSEEVAGILCLCFRFENEMKRIFKKLATDYDGSVIMILDKNSAVIASSDENHVPVGTQVEPVEDSENAIVYYCGNAYISKTVFTQGYQGYFGLGWKGHIIIPLRIAFREKAALQSIDQNVMAGLMNNADSFSKALNDIIDKTEAINGSLKRIVYNGQIIAKDNGINDEFSKLKAILSAIGKIGSNTSGLFQSSVQNLFATVVSTSLLDAGFLASLCVEIMDRNLYERSDDCRWWALNSTFCTILAKEEITERDKAKLTKILMYIHSLYTVYSNLFLFDSTGKIIAVSSEQHKDDIGKILNDAYIHNILSNTQPEQYYVSPFMANDLYNNQYTYVYGASVTDIQNNNRTVGGIGIVFDSTFQFKEMLKDALKSKENAFAVFTDREGMILSSTNEDLKIGKKIELSSRFFQVENGATLSEVLIYGGCSYAVGCACSSSYREYKHKDGYQNDVLAFVFQKLADYDEKNIANSKSSEIQQSDIELSNDEPHEKLVAFEVNGQMFALKQSAVLEAIDAENIVSLPGCNNVVAGVVPYHEKYLAVLDVHALFHQNLIGRPFEQLVIVKLSDNSKIALKVDELENVLEINQSDVNSIPAISGVGSAIEGVVCFHNADNRTMLVLNHEELFMKLKQGNFRDEWNEVFSTLADMNVESPVK